MPSEGTTRDRLLEAALAGAAVHGIARLSMADVAQGAGCSRQTLYKHFPSKQALIAGVVAREAGRITEEVVAAVNREPDTRAAIEAGMLSALRLTRDHPLLDRLVRTEPELLLPFITAESSPAMLLVRAAVDSVLAGRFPDLEALDRRRLADIVTRLLVSYAVSAPDDPPEEVASSVARYLVDGLSATLR